MTQLIELVDALGPEVLEAPVAPEGLAFDLKRTILFDCLDRPEFAEGDLVLALGVSCDSAFATLVVRAGASAVMFRHAGALPNRLVAEALDSGTCILTLAPSCDWSQVHEVVLSLPSRRLPSREASLTGTELMQDLFAIVNGVAEVVEAPVTIEDNQSRLLAYSVKQEGADLARSATILGHRVPDAYRREVRRLGVAKRLLTDTKPFHIVSSLPEISSRMVVAIRARDQVLGSMWAVSDRPFDADRTEAFSDAARTAAVRLLHHRLTSDIQRRQQSASLALLLAGSEAGIESARRAGLSGEAFQVLAVACADGGQVDDELLDRCWSTLSMRLSLAGPGTITGRVADTVYCVQPVGLSASQALADSRAVLSSLVAGLEAPQRQQLVLAISGSVSRLADLASAREEADRVLAVLRQTGGRIAHIDEVALRVTLSRLQELERGRSTVAERILAGILAHDADHQTGYYETVRLYLAAFGDANVAAEALEIHTNTLRYRLRRITESFGVDLTDEDVRFALMLHFRLHER